MFNSLLSTKAKRAVYLIVLFIVVSCTATFMIFQHRAVISGSFDVGVFDFDLSYSELLVMFTAGLWGIVPSVVAFMLLFADSLYYDIESTYTISIYLIAMLGSYLLANRKVFKHLWSTILGFFVLNVFMGGIWSVVGTIAEGEGLSGITQSAVFHDQILVTAECFVYCMVMYLFMNKAPAKIKQAFPVGIHYVEEGELVGAFRNYQFIHDSRISRKLLKVVVLQVLCLGIAAASFAAGLMPSIADEVLSDTASDTESFFRFKPSEKPGEAPLKSGEAAESDESGAPATEGQAAETMDGGQVGTPVLSAEERKNSIEHRLQQQRFILNNAGASFVFKLIIMIINVSVPLVVLENALVQWLVARPVAALANSLNGFAGADRIEQQDKLKTLEGMRVKGNDEISDLYESISDMAHQINENVDQMLREAELEEEIRVAQRAAESQTNFLNNVSHELRTPINAVLGLDEMIVRETNEDNIRDYANDIASAGKSLLSLVNDILDSSKLAEGKMEILPAEYELGSTINDIVNMIAVKARDKGLSFDMDIDEHLPHILIGDEIRIKQVIVNILTNAVKYTNEGGFTMKMGFKKVSDDEILLTCSVSDTGIGIRKEDMGKLFARFERIEESRNRTTEGTGLGMNIVQQLLGLMDSELHVESEYGKGSTFSFEVKQKVVSWDEMGDFVESYRRSLETAKKHTEGFVAPEACILVTDDTPMNLTVICGLLKPTQIKIDTAKSGAETLEMVQKKKYDVIFLDHRMPEMDGVETLAHMKELSDNPNADTPVISLTANAISGARETYLSEGFSDYLSKPIDTAKLNKMLMDYLPSEKIVSEDAGAASVAPTAPAHAAGAVPAAPTPVITDEASPVILRVAKNPCLKEFAEIPGIDYAQAIKNCSNEDILSDAARDYCEDILKKAELIEKYEAEGDYENYTVLVHALKSSSRLIGAMSLSDEAKRLENYGNHAINGDKRAMSEIKKRTPMLLEIYRGYYDFMAPIFICPHAAAGAAQPDDPGFTMNGGGLDEGIAGELSASADPRPEIPEQKLMEGLICLHDLAEAFDFDSMECVLGMMDEYRMPADFAPHYERIKEEIHNVDSAALIGVIDEYLQKRS